VGKRPAAESDMRRVLKIPSWISLLLQVLDVDATTCMRFMLVGLSGKRLPADAEFLNMGNMKCAFEGAMLGQLRLLLAAPGCCRFLLAVGCCCSCY